MKVLKIVGGLIAVIVVIVVVLGIIAPNCYSVERTIVIDAPPNMVFDYIRHWENLPEWSPWSQQDPSIESTIEGEDGTVGSVYRWEGGLLRGNACERRQIQSCLGILRQDAVSDEHLFTDSKHGRNHEPGF